MTRIFTKAALMATTLVMGAGAGLAQDKPAACETGYSATDVDDNGYVSTIEMNAYAEQQTKDMDADSSGGISRDEYVNCSLAGQTAATSTRTEDDMSALDLNDDGSISLSEYIAGGAETYDSAKGGDSAATERAGRLIFIVEGQTASDMSGMTRDEYAARSYMLFSGLDRDSDDALTREEFMDDAVTTNFSDIRNAEFDAADTDASGELTTTELIEYNQSRADKAMSRAEEDTGEAADSERGVPVMYFYHPYRG